MTKEEAIRSIFDLMQSEVGTPAEAVQAWLVRVFPSKAEHSAVQLVSQLEKLFEMAVFENEVDTVHVLLQQGFPPDVLGDWQTTPLMWATCLGHDKIATLLKGFGANSEAVCFSGKKAKDFQRRADFPEYQAILRRKEEIHAQVMAGALKPFLGTTGAASGESTERKKPKAVRQIDNGKGVDELFKRMKSKEVSGMKTDSYAMK